MGGDLSPNSVYQAQADEGEVDNFAEDNPDASKEAVDAKDVKVEVEEEKSAEASAGSKKNNKKRKV